METSIRHQNLVLLMAAEIDANTFLMDSAFFRTWNYYVICPIRTYPKM